MLDLVEKIATGACGLLVLVTLCFYAFFGVPSTISTIHVSSVIPEAAPVSGQPAQPGAGDPVPPTDRMILTKLEEQGVKTPPNQGLMTKRFSVPRDLYTRVSAEANWPEELHKVQPEMRKNPNGKDTRMKLLNIEDDSMLLKLGFEENDVIELLDGEVVDFNEQSVYRHRELWKGSLKKLENGQPISVTITRNGRPIHLQFKL